jgi:RNA polymerase sigma-70 factor, ECF subfamily
MADRVGLPDDDLGDIQLVQTLTSHQLDIYFYVRSLLVDPNDVAEIVQETNLVLWEKRDQFQAVKDFRAWAFQIARYKVLQHQTERKRRKCLAFSDSLIDELAIQAPHYAKADNDLMDGLNHCVDRLTTRDQTLLRQRYASLASCERIAEAMGRSVRWVYNSLNRIRQELFDCMAQYAKARRER